MTQNWETLADWWATEVETDPAYREEVLPLLLEVLRPQAGRRYLDLGCGQGQGSATVAQTGASVVGCDVSASLLRQAPGMRVRCRLPDLGWARDGAFDGAFAVLVLEHLADVERLFAETHRVVSPRGRLAVVLNHPVFTAPGAGPFVDPTDGETLWRWGRYLTPGSTEEPAGDRTVTFHHRPIGEFLTTAAATGWSLERLVEQPVGEAAADRDPLLAAQRDVPRLLGVAWVRGA